MTTCLWKFCNKYSCLQLQHPNTACTGPSFSLVYLPVICSIAAESFIDVWAGLGLQASSMAFLEFHLRSVLANDSSAISTLRCLKLYLERLGCNHLDTGTMHAVAGCAFQLVRPSTLMSSSSNAWAPSARRLAAEMSNPVPAAEALHRMSTQECRVSCTGTGCIARLLHRFASGNIVGCVCGGAEGIVAGAQVTQSLPDIAFLNCRPSVIAAAIVYAERRSRGIIPFWPSMLSKLSGYQVCCSPRPLEIFWCHGCAVEHLSRAGVCKVFSVHAVRLCWLALHPMPFGTAAGTALNHFSIPGGQRRRSWC